MASCTSCCWPQTLAYLPRQFPSSYTYTYDPAVSLLDIYPKQVKVQGVFTKFVGNTYEKTMHGFQRKFWYQHELTFQLCFSVSFWKCPCIHIPKHLVVYSKYIQYSLFMEQEFGVALHMLVRVPSCHVRVSGVRPQPWSRLQLPAGADAGRHQ